MPPARIAPQTLLEALDPDLGGLASGTAAEIWENLRDRGIDSDPAAVRRTLEALAHSRQVERVEREEGPPVYTRPGVLLRAMGILKPSTRQPNARATHL
jgi:hypothetical protein